MRGLTETIKSEEVGVDNMARGSGSKRCVELAYNYLQTVEEKEATTLDIMHSINNRKVTTGCRKTKETWSVQQISQILRKSPYFIKVGTVASIAPSGTSSTCCVYKCASVKDVVTKKLSYRHSISTYKAIPKFAREEYVKQGGVL